MNRPILRGLCAGLAAIGLAACGGGGGGGISVPADEVPAGAGTPSLSDRTAVGAFDATYVVLQGNAVAPRRSVSFRGETGVITGQLLDGTDIDSGVVFTNPANGEFSRVVRISGDNVFGVVGLDVPSSNLPESGSVTNYNEGWVGLTAAFETGTLVLTGDAAFTVEWGGGGGISGVLSNFNVESSSGGSLSSAGSIVLTDGTVSGGNFTFGAGTISGTGSFADLGGAGTSSSTTGTFFGPEADELGGIILIDDPTDDILILGAFQAD